MTPEPMSADRTAPRVSRRAVLHGATGLAVGSLALSSCASGGQKQNSGDVNSDVPTPRHIPYEGVKPDIASVGDYGTAGFLRYPDPPVQAVKEKPSTGGTVRLAVALDSAVPTPMARNAWWQNINQTIGAELQLDTVPTSRYAAKLATLVAGNDIPDIVQIPREMPDKASVLDALFTELSDYIAGDAIAEYPLLANISTVAWKSVVFNGGIYGVPMPLLAVSGRMSIRKDIFDELQLDAAPSNAEEFRELCRALTDAKVNRWAMMHPQVTGFIAEMFGVPNQWRITDGKFIRDIESDEYLQTMEYIIGMWKEGLFHPDSFSGSLDTYGMFQSRRVPMIYSGGYAIVSTHFLFKQADPRLEVGFLAPPKADGGGAAAKHLGSGHYTFVALKKGPKERTQEMLRVLNSMSAPFGTAEYLAVQFGAKEADYIWDAANGGPVTTARATTEKLPLNYVPGSPNVYYAPGYPGIVTAACDYEKTVLKNVVPLPTIGLYSPTYHSKNAALDRIITNGTSEIVQGRKPLSSWSEVVNDWKRNGGDTMRAEYEAQYEKTQGR